MRAEALPVDAIGVLLAGLSLVMALLAVVSSIAVQSLYALNVFASAVAFTLIFVCLRRARRRVATLSPRDPGRVAPPYVWMLVATAVVLPLLWLHDEPVAAALVTAAGVAIVSSARQVAAMPAFLHGDDLGVETYVDSRLRTVRAAMLLALAVAPGYVFAAFSGYNDAVRALAIAKVVSIAIGLIAAGVTAARLFALASRRPTQRDAESW